MAWRRDVVDGPKPGSVDVALGWTPLSFVLLAILQNQDLLFAAHLLPAQQLSRFAVLSTLGGLAAFATATVPLVLLPHAGRPGRALPVALGTAAALGAAAVSVLLIGGRPVVEMLFGTQYGSVAPLASAYVLGMALLGVTRVLVADAIGQASARCALVAITVVAHGVGLIIAFHDSAAPVARATIGSLALLTGAVTTVALVPPGALSRVARDSARASRPVGLSSRDLPRWPSCCAS